MKSPLRFFWARRALVPMCLILFVGGVVNCRRIEEASAPASAESSASLTIAYSGNIDGEIEPCG